MASDKKLLGRKGTTRNTVACSEPLPKRRVCTEAGLYKFLTVLYGISFFNVGLLMLVIGVWVVSIKRQYQAINDVLTCPAMMTITVAVLMILTAAVGIIGGTKDKLLLLRLFLVIVTVVFIIQVIIGIIAFIFREETITTVDSQLKEAMMHYQTVPEYKAAFDRIQQMLHCCGRQSAGDWNLIKNFTCNVQHSPLSCSVPDTCCVNLETGCGLNALNITVAAKTNIHHNGCTHEFVRWIENKLDIVGAIALGFAILHIIGIFFVYMLVVKMEDRARLFKYRTRYYNNS